MCLAAATGFALQLSHGGWSYLDVLQNGRMLVIRLSSSKMPPQEVNLASPSIYLSVLRSRLRVVLCTQGHGGQLEQVPIATGWRQSETLTKRPVHRKATLTQTYYIYIVFFKHYMHVFWTVEGRWRTRREAQQTQGGHVKCTLKGPIPGVKPKTFLLWCRSNLCANVLPILCGLKKNKNKKKNKKRWWCRVNQSISLKLTSQGNKETFGSHLQA